MLSIGWFVTHLFLRCAWYLRHGIALILLHWLLLIGLSRTSQRILFNDYFLWQSHLRIEMVLLLSHTSSSFRRRR